MPFPFLIAAGGAVSERLLFSVLIQLAVIILTARLFACLFHKLRQPAVVGEIAAGMILGPSVLGKIALLPWAAGTLGVAYEWVFHPWNFFPTGASTTAPYHQILLEGLPHVMPILSQLGLVLLLFMIGLEFDFAHLRARGRAAALISVSGIAVPFASGFLLGQLLHPHLAAGTDRLAFSLFIGVATSITAMPVLGRMLVELKISRTRVGTIAMIAAAIGDAAGWIMLAGVSAIAVAATRNSESGDHQALAHTLRMIGAVLAFAAFMIFFVRPIMRRWTTWLLKRNDGALGSNGLAILLAILFVCAITTSYIGIFAIFGAFILGAVLSSEHDFRDAVHHTLGQFVNVFFLPIFFTYTGLRTDIGSLGSGMLWASAAALCAVAVVGKLGGCWAAARLGGLPARESICIGVMMNTRGLMELIVANVGYDLGVIPKSVFCMLVIMALLTTIMTTPLLQWSARGTELEAGMVSAGFLPGKPDAHRPSLRSSELFPSPPPSS